MSKAHQAIISISVYVHEVETTGELGKSVGLKAQREAGLKNFLITIKPGSPEEVAAKVAAILAAIKELGAT